MTRARQKPFPSYEELWARPDVTITEAAHLMGRSDVTIAKWVKDKEVRSYVDGKCVRILTRSLRERSEAKVAEQMGEAA